MKILVVAMIAPAQDTKQQEPIVQPFLKPVSCFPVRRSCLELAIDLGVADRCHHLVLVVQLVSYHDTRRP